MGKALLFPPLFKSMKKLLTIIISICVVFLAVDSIYKQLDGQMEITHILLFKWNQDVQNERIEEMDGLWKSLAREINGFKSYEMNRVDSKEFDSVVILKFGSQKAYDDYTDHIDHQRIRRLGQAIVAGFSTFSYDK